MTKLPSYVPLPEETMEAQIVRADRKANVERVLAIHWPEPGDRMRDVDDQLPADDTVYRWKQPEPDRPPYAEPVVTPSFGLTVLLVGIALGSVLTGCAFMAAVKWGII